MNSAPVVRIFDGTLPITRWPRPAMIAASSGRKTIAWITGLPLHPVGIVDGNGAAAAEVNNENGKADGGFTRCHGQHEHREDLSDERSEEHTSELQSLMRISYAVFCLKKKNRNKRETDIIVNKRNKRV